ncbi:hypothetical protein QJQ45_004650 [Haematococcus lacustris]|nr:hypothetical protein QJQ45_004650 [Haematococcus lacustris]
MGDATALELTPAELSFYDGAARSQVYIAVQGTIYDVTSGASFYGPALMKIDVAECTSDLTGLTPKNLSTLQDWVGLQGLLAVRVSAQLCGAQQRHSAPDVRKFAAKYPVVGQLRKQ